MTVLQVRWYEKFLPKPNTASGREQLRAGIGAVVGLMLTGFLSYFVFGDRSGMAFLVAPMGASSVLLFGVPASPLAQPWSAFGGNLVSALVGVTCAQAIGDPMLAAPVAGGLAILSMFLLRCLHPPGGAVALTAVLAGPAVHAAGYEFAFMQVGLNTALLVLAALAYNNLTGRRYPHTQQSSMQPIHDTRDPVPLERIGFTREDLDAVLKSYGQVLDVSRDDLEEIIIATEMKAYERRFGTITCGDIMSTDAVTLEFSSSLREAWQLLRHHQLHALPVLNKARRVIGIVAQNDFLRRAGVDELASIAQRLRRFLAPSSGSNWDKPEMVGQMMVPDVVTAKASTPIVELVPLMANSGMHHLPIVDDEGRFVGMISQSDLLAALYESSLGTQATAVRGTP
jgi:CBS domain-containing membrane protein